ncbi:MAG TPA: hypothetical protein VFV19_03005 [Candidatus Polarisedimenticolaceae bacterium]|nr:hypothetical protein [Candidatus Polarisedimenticolaceae bacterium]
MSSSAAPAPRSSHVVLGTVVRDTIRRAKGKRGRPILAFALELDVPGLFRRQRLQVTVRGEEARRLGRVIVGGMRLRLTGKVRTVTYLRVERVSPEVERWKAKALPLEKSGEHLSPALGVLIDRVPTPVSEEPSGVQAHAANVQGWRK